MISKICIKKNLPINYIYVDDDYDTTTTTKKKSQKFFIFIQLKKKIHIINFYKQKFFSTLLLVMNDTID